MRIKAELDEARALRDEAQTLLAGYERRQKEVRAQAEDIVAAARAEAEKAAEAAKEDIRRSVARRMQTATEQIAAAEQAAVRQIKDRAVAVAVAAAGDVLRERMQGRGRQPADRRARSPRSAPSCTEAPRPTRAAGSGDADQHGTSSLILRRSAFRS